MPGQPDFEIPVTVLCREVQGEMVLLELEQEHYYGLDPVGSRIVTRLTEQPYDEALAALREEFEVDAAVLARDVEELVGRLVEAGLLARVDAPA